jgi:hypothetical protein
MTRFSIIAASLVALTLAGCSQENAPSDTISEAADQVVEQVDGGGPVKLAQGPYAPRDECRETPGASDFRKQLELAVSARDADRLAALAAPDVKLDFGGGSGTALLVEKLGKNERDLWGELADLLALGCGVNDQGGITLPWYEAKPIPQVDPGTAMLVTGENIPLRTGVEDGAAKVAAVSWDVVTLVGGLQPEDEFQKVRTADGKTGFVATDKLRSLLDYRLIASSRDGKWSFTSLVAGD